MEENEVLLIELYSRNRLFADKILGSFRLVLQKVVKDGRLSICDSLLDPNNKPLPVSQVKLIEVRHGSEISFK